MPWSELYDCMISNGSSTCDTLSDSEYFRALARRWSGVQISRSFWTSTTWSDNRRSHEEMLPDTHWRLCWNMIIQHHPKHRGVQFPRHSTSIPHVIWVMSYSTTRRIASQHLHLGAAALWDCFFDATSNMLITQYMLDIFRYLVHPCSCMFIVHILLSFQKHLVSWVGLFLPGFPAFGSSASKTSLRSAVLAVSNLAFNWRSNKNYSNCFGTKRTHKQHINQSSDFFCCWGSEMFGTQYIFYVPGISINFIWLAPLQGNLVQPKSGKTTAWRKRLPSVSWANSATSVDTTARHGCGTLAFHGLSWLTWQLQVPPILFVLPTLSHLHVREHPSEALGSSLRHVGPSLKLR